MSEEYSGKEGKFLPPSLSRKWVANFRKNNPKHTHAFFFGCELFENLLKEPGCVGIRIYYAQGDDGSPKMVLVGVNQKGDNIIKKTVKVPTELRLSSTDEKPNTSERKSVMGPEYEEDDSDSGMVDGGMPCPEFCGGGIGFP